MEKEIFTHEHGRMSLSERGPHLLNPGKGGGAPCCFPPNCEMDGKHILSLVHEYSEDQVGLGSAAAITGVKEQGGGQGAGRLQGGNGGVCGLFVGAARSALGWAMAAIPRVWLAQREL